MNWCDLSLVLFVLLGFAKSQICPVDWVEDERSNSCYLFVYGSSRQKSVDDARSVCQARQGDLLKVDDTNELNWLLSELRKLENSYDGEHEWWTGLNNIENEREWKWTDGSLLQPNVITWGQGEPNNIGDERCAEIWDFHFNDKSCATPLNYICERSKNKPVMCDADRGWVNLHNYCYKFYPQNETWRQANYICEQSQATLAVVRSMDVQKSLIGYDSKQTDMWLGLRSVPSGAKDFLWQWANGASLDHSVTFWKKEIGSSYAPSTNKCVEMLLSAKDSLLTGNWKVEDCFQSRPFVCQKTKGVCPPGTFQYQTTCYEVVSTEISWSMANGDCQLRGGSLLNINSENEQKYINSLLRQIFQSGIVSIWLGISDNNIDGGSWIWTTGDALGSSYSNWAEDELRNTKGIQDCAFIYTDDLMGRWVKTAFCTRPHAYICKSFVGRRASVSPRESASFECEAGWDLYDGSCFLFSDMIATWRDARTECQSYEADLVVLDDLEESDFIYSKINSNCWIGLNDEKTEGNFVWLDSGEQPEFFHWNVGEPNNINNEDCVALVAERDNTRNSKWNDFLCEKKFTFICEKIATNATAQRTSSTTTERSKTTSSRAIITAGGTVARKTTTTTATTTTTEYVNARCGQFWEEDPNTDYCYLHRDEQVTWEDAVLSCLRYGGNLASISNIQEQFFIAGFLRGRSVRSLKLWIGANDIGYEGGWMWSDKSPFGFIYWATGEPSADDDNLDCAAMFVRETTWGSFTCNSQAGYICKKFIGVKTTTRIPIPPTHAAGLYYGCTSGYMEYKSACFSVVREKKTWLEARAYCRQQHGDLARIADEEDQNFIYSLLPEDVCYNMFHTDSSCTKWAAAGECQKNPVWMARQCHHACDYCIRDCKDKHNTERCQHWATIGECVKNPKWMLLNCAYSCGICDSAIYGGFWIGLNDRVMPMSYRWSDGLDITYTRWARSEPNNLQKNRCVSLYVQNGHWNTRDCEERLPGFVCRQAKAVLPLTITTDTVVEEGCGNLTNSVAYDASCYLFVDDKKNWNEADDFCIQNGGHLVTVHDRFIQSFLASQLYSRTDDHWIGLSGNDTYKWRDGSTVDFTHWARNYPVSDQGSCGAMVIEHPIGFWKTLSCLEEKPFICEFTREGFTRMPEVEETTVPIQLPPCLDGWKDYEGYCYKAFLTRLPWVTARDNCQNIGGDLMSLHSRADTNFLYDLLLRGQQRAPVVWIGLNDRDREDGFMWSDGSPVQYTNWQESQPDDYAQAEDCVVFYRYRKQWNDMSCFLSKPYVCQVKQGMFINSTSTANETDVPVQKVVCEHKADTISCPPGKNISILSGDYGRTSTEICPHPADGDTSCSAGSSAEEIIVSACSGKNSCRLEAYNRVFGDPCPGIFKYMDVTYSCSNGETESRCGDGWILHGQFCYYFSVNFKAGFLSWHDAQDYCQKEGGDLASIHGASENNFIKTESSKTLNKKSWIGFHELGSNNFRWSDNTKVDFLGWRPEGKGSDKCASFDDGWMTDHCSTRYPFICRRPENPVTAKTPTSPPVISGGCREQFQQIGNKCFFVGGKDNDSFVSIEAASTACHKFGDGYLLASISSASEQAFVTTLMYNLPHDLWIGLRFHKRLGYTWEDNSRRQYSNWRLGETFEVQQRRGFVAYGMFQRKMTKTCAVMTFSDSSISSVGKWKASKCDLKLPYLCQGPTISAIPVATPASGPCPTSYTSFRTDCYRVYTQPLNWSDALSVCQSAGSSLISITDIFEDSYITVLTLNKIELFWIGLKWLTDEEEFLWTDQLDLSYTKWAADQPTISQEDSCVVNKDGSWNVTDCSEKYPFICKRSSSEDITGTVSKMPPLSQPTSSLAYCFNQYWRSFGDYCYYLSIKHAQTWSTANQICRLMGMELVSVHSKLETQFIMQEVQENLPDDMTESFQTHGIKLWTGLRRSGSGYYQWSDLSALGYIDWHDGEPKIGKTLEWCVEMTGLSGHWSSLPCTERRGFVCKAAKVTPSTPVPSTTVEVNIPGEFFPGRPDYNPNRSGNQPSYFDPQRASEDHPKKSLSSGQIAGIVLGMAGFLVIVVCAAVVVRRIQTGAKYTRSQQGFDNALYTSDNQSVFVEDSFDDQGLSRS